MMIMLDNQDEIVPMSKTCIHGRLEVQSDALVLSVALEPRPIAQNIKSPGWVKNRGNGREGRLVED
jgi:hypothetical protein